MLNLAHSKHLGAEVGHRIDQAAVRLGVAMEALPLIKQAHSSLQIRFPLRLRGKLELFTGWRTIHSTQRLPAKGGMRFSANLHQGEVDGLAALMAYKCALMDVPFGGAFSGLCLPVNDYSAEEREMITRSFTRELVAEAAIGPSVYVPEPDMGTGAMDMAWIMDSYRQLHPEDLNYMAVVTGKPVEQGGLAAREEATAKGIEFALLAFFAYPSLAIQYGLRPEIYGQRIVLQGLGNVGFHTAKRLSEEYGAKIIAVIEHDGVVINARGVDLDGLKSHLQITGGVRGFDDALDQSHCENALGMACDILIPAAHAAAIHQLNAAFIQAKLIVEAANAPVTHEAEKILLENGKVILPDIYANAGGVVVSYYEWARNLAHMRYGRLEDRLLQHRSERLVEAIELASGNELDADLKRSLVRNTNESDWVEAGLQGAMVDGFEALQAVVESEHCDYRAAAYLLAVKKLLKGYQALGSY